jgi:hypothetical protein
MEWRWQTQLTSVSEVPFREQQVALERTFCLRTASGDVLFMLTLWLVFSKHPCKPRSWYQALLCLASIALAMVAYPACSDASHINIMRLQITMAQHTFVCLKGV